MDNHRFTRRLVVFGAIAAAIALISLNAGGGSLDPTAPPGPTMRTLDEIYNAVVDPMPTAAAIDMFLKIDGVPGEATDDGHKDWINLLSVSQGISRPVVRDSTGGTQQDPASLTDFKIIKRIDKSTPLMTLYCCNGQHIGDVQIDMVKATGDGSRQTYLKYKLTDVIVTSYDLGGSTGDPQPIESIAFNYTKIEWSYSSFDDAGNQTGTVTSDWDLLNNVAP